MLEEQLLPRLEPVFDRLAGPEAWIELGQLEVPLSRLDPQASEADWLEKTCRACIGALEQEMQKPAATKRSGSPENALAVLACFLERGHLPWWVEDYELEAAVQNIIPTQAPSILKLLRPVNAQKRWARQFGPAIQEQLLRATGKNPFLSQREWRDLFPELTAQKSSLVYWETIWEAREQPGSFTENWMRNLLLQSLHLLPADKALRKLSALHENAAPLHRLCSIAQELFPFTPAQWAKILPRQKARQVYWEAFREAKTAPVDFRQNWVDLLVRKTMLAGLGDSGWAALMETVRQSPALSGPQKDQLQAAIAGRQLPVRYVEDQRARADAGARRVVVADADPRPADQRQLHNDYIDPPDQPRDRAGAADPAQCRTEGQQPADRPDFPGRMAADTGTVAVHRPRP